jgi:hypothetical protein
MNSFDAIKNYYVFKYVVDSVSEQPTNHEGEIIDIIKGTDSITAMIEAGYDDFNVYGCNLMDESHIDKLTNSIEEERKLLSKLSKKLKGLQDERDEAMKKFMEERPCPNGCGKLNEKFNCDVCGYGKEAEALIKELDKVIKDGKKLGEDMTNLEALRSELEKTL